MGGHVHKPVTWNRAAAAQWAGGQRNEATKVCLEALDANPDPDADAFIQPGFYLFQLEQFELGTRVLKAGLTKFPDHPMILLSLGCSYSRWHKDELAIPLLERFLALGYIDASAYDALTTSCGATGDMIRARMFGTMSLDEKDQQTRARHGSPKLDFRCTPGKRRRIITFSLFGSRPRYLRGALQNVLAARDLYPGWTCRFYVDDSVDSTFRAVMADEGAELITDDSGERDLRHLLCRRFLVSDDTEVGHFMVRDCDSVVNAREAAAVAEWIDSGLPFHAMRDWYTHADPVLAGLWGGVAGVFPDMAGSVARFRKSVPLSTNWDQFFLRDQVWPAIRDHCLVHDRCFESYRARPFPTPTPGGKEHVGQNEYATDKQTQAAALAAYAERIPALALARAINFDFKLG